MLSTVSKQNISMKNRIKTIKQQRDIFHLMMTQPNDDMEEEAQTTKEIVLEFCQETTFHAIKFFTRKGGNVITR